MADAGQYYNTLNTTLRVRDNMLFNAAIQCGQVALAQQGQSANC